jgi:hypothetical protein
MPGRTRDVCHPINILTSEPFFQQIVVLADLLDNVGRECSLEERGRDGVVRVETVRDVEHVVRANVEEFPRGKVRQEFFLALASGDLERAGEETKLPLLHCQDQTKRVKLEVTGYRV